MQLTGGSGAGGCGCNNGALPFLTQAAWYVNAVSGSDANNGATPATALKTLPELARRWNGRVFDPSVLAVTVVLTGPFVAPTNYLVLNAAFANSSTTVDISGQMTALSTGAVTAFTAKNAATGVRSTFTDAAANFTPNKGQRIRLTSGANAGALTHYNSVAAATAANNGRFWKNTAFTGTPVNPVVNDQYVVESYATVLAGFQLNLLGPQTVTLRDLEFGDGTLICESFGQGTRSYDLICFGCSFNTPLNANQILWAATSLSLTACRTRGVSATGFQMWGAGTFRENGCCHFGLTQRLGVAVAGQENTHDGDGAACVGMLVENGAQQEDFSDRGFFGSTNGTVTELVRCEDAGNYICDASGARLWGNAVTGPNTCTNALRVRNGSGFQYVTLPTVLGAVAGNDVVLAGAAPIAWGALPAAAAAPNNAYAVVRQ